jgi:DNA-binding transcriptional MerR regulator
MARNGITIGRLASQSGCKVQTIRYYEGIGLLPAPARSEGNQRRYGAADLERLLFIRQGRELGFPLEAIRELIQLATGTGQSCASADRIARSHLAEVEARLAQLTGLRDQLRRIIGACGQDTVETCTILGSLHRPGEPPP